MGGLDIVNKLYATSIKAYNHCYSLLVPSLYPVCTVSDCFSLSSLSFSFSLSHSLSLSLLSLSLSLILSPLSLSLPSNQYRHHKSEGREKEERFDSRREETSYQFDE